MVYWILKTWKDIVENGSSVDRSVLVRTKKPSRKKEEIENVE
jgi:hypothetical protein